MGYDTFASLTISEFENAFGYWQKIQQRNERTPWEVMRMQVAMTLQPFVKGNLDPKKILPLPWDHPERPEVTEAEKKRQTERVKKYLATGHWD